MANDPKIGLDLSNPDHQDVLRKAGIPLVMQNKKLALGESEPEGKISFPSISGFNAFSTAVEHSSNAFFIPGQSVKSSHTLISMDLKDPLGQLEANGLRLRFRLNFDPKTCSFLRAEINLKSTLESGQGEYVSGMICRHEIESPIYLTRPIIPQIQSFLDTTAAKNPSIKCCKIDASLLGTPLLIHTLRTDYALFLADRHDKTGHVLHPAGDLVLNSDPFGQILNPATDIELEFECKQAFGNIPPRFSSPREFFVSTLNGATGHFQSIIHGATPLTQSKLERGGDVLTMVTGFSKATYPAPLIPIDDVLRQNLNCFASIALRLGKQAAGIVVPEGNFNFNRGAAIQLNPSFCQREFMGLEAA